MYSYPDSATFVGATWTKVGTPTRSIAATMPIVVSRLVVLNAPATSRLETHSSMTSSPLTKAIGCPFTWNDVTRVSEGAVDQMWRFSGASWTYSSGVPWATASSDSLGSLSQWTARPAAT